MLNTFYDSYTILNKVYGGAFLRQAFLSTTIEELNRAMTVKICYGVLDKDIELSYVIEKFCDKNPKLAIRTLLKIGIYCIKYLGKKPYAVTDNLVELCKKLGKGGASGFVNAFMRRFLKETVSPPENKLKMLSVKYNYPEFAVKKLIEAYGDEAYALMAFDEEKTFVRFSKEFDGEGYLTEKGYSYKKTIFNQLFEVDHIAKNNDFDTGVFTFQSIGSVAICNLIESGSALLDCCAAPGGKSVLLSDKFNSITAFELHEHRVELIKAYAKRMKVFNIEVVCRDSSIFDKAYEHCFDAVLCDVPCSSYGTLKQNPDVKLKKSAETIFELNKTQLAILSTCSRYVKKGGSLYYSTCSIFREENDKIVEKFLAENKSFSVEKISSPLNSLTTNCGLQFLPHISCGVGFFVAKLKNNETD